MAVSNLEVVELSTGEFALRRSESEDAPLVKIGFSEEARLFLGQHEATIVRAMISAGIEAAASLSAEAQQGEESATSQTVH